MLSSYSLRNLLVVFAGLIAIALFGSGLLFSEAFAIDNMQQATPDEVATIAYETMVAALSATPPPPTATWTPFPTSTPTSTPTPTPTFVSPAFDPPQRREVLPGEELVLQGRGEPGAMLEIQINNQLGFTATIDSEGAWSHSIVFDVPDIYVVTGRTVHTGEIALAAAMPVLVSVPTPTATHTPSPTITATPTLVPTATSTPIPLPSLDAAEAQRVVEEYRLVEQRALGQLDVMAIADLHLVSAGEAFTALVNKLNDLVLGNRFESLAVEVTGPPQTFFQDGGEAGISICEMHIVRIYQRTDEGDQLVNEEQFEDCYAYGLVFDNGRWKVNALRSLPE